MGPSARARAASFVPIGPAEPDDGYSIVLWGLSGDGRVAVGERFCFSDRECGNAPALEAVRWTEQGGVEPLGLLPGGYAESSAFAASHDGSQVVGFSHAASGSLAFRWRAEAGLESIDPGPPPGLEQPFSIALQTSADGSVVVGYRVVEHHEAGRDGTGDGPITIAEPFIWSASGGMRGLPVPEAHGLNNIARDVSADGRVVVGRFETSGGLEAFVWDEQRGMRTLGRTGGEEALSTARVSSLASAISADGSTIVGHVTIESEGDRLPSNEPFLYTPEAGMQRLGNAAERFSMSVASDISGDGSLVVGTGWLDPFEEGEAFVWDPDHGIRLLRDVLSSLGVDLAGWRLISAQAISRDGSSILGAARDPAGRFRSYLAVVPEPAGAVLIALGLAVMGFSRSWRNKVAPSTRCGEAGASPEDRALRVPVTSGSAPRRSDGVREVAFPGSTAGSSADRRTR